MACIGTGGLMPDRAGRFLPWERDAHLERAMDIRAGAMKGTCLHAGATQQRVFEKPVEFPEGMGMKMWCRHCGLHWTRIIRP